VLLPGYGQCVFASLFVLRSSASKRTKADLNTLSFFCFFSCVDVLVSIMLNARKATV
jgi:hypothetical protein